MFMCIFIGSQKTDDVTHWVLPDINIGVMTLGFLSIII